MTNETFQQSSRRPFDLPWNYDRTELRADGVVHAIGLGLALVAAMEEKDKKRAPMGGLSLPI
jgi:hypothetical protein